MVKGQKRTSRRSSNHGEDNIITNGSGIAVADRHAVAAENAVAGNDLCVTLIDADGLDRAEPDAFVAVFAVGLFETQNIHGAPAFL